MASTYEPIATTTLGSSASSITLSSIPNTYTDFRVVIVGTVNSGGGPSVTFNGDTGSNYSRTYIVGNGSAVSTSTTTSAQSFNLGYWDTTYPCMATLDVFSYAGSKYKTALGDVASDQNSTLGRVQKNIAVWLSTSAITSVTFSASFDAGTKMTIYGIKAA